METTINRDMLITRLRSMSADVGGLPSNENTGESFGPLLKQLAKGVSDRQLQASSMAERFEFGDNEVSMADVMIEIQKARVSFEALTQVRNKFVEAYQQVMSMPL